jgi:hypothetical protein
MAVVISEILTEVVLTQREGADGSVTAGGASSGGAAGGILSEDAMDAVVRHATERVLEVLRRDWDR